MEPLTRFRSPRSRDQSFSLCPPNSAIISSFFLFSFFRRTKITRNRREGSIFHPLAGKKKFRSIITRKNDEKNRSLFRFTIFSISLKKKLINFFSTKVIEMKEESIFFSSIGIFLFKIMRRRIDLCFNLEFCKFLFDENYKNEKRIFFSLVKVFLFVKDWWEEESIYILIFTVNFEIFKNIPFFPFFTKITRMMRRIDLFPVDSF